MRAKLFCRTGQLAGVDHQIVDEATLGRSAENTLVLGASVISQTHARIFFDAKVGGYILEDLESKNGTRLDGIRVRARERLRDLHVVTLGEEHDFMFVVLPESTARADDGHASTARGPSEPSESASKTLYEPPAALQLPSFEQRSEARDDAAASAPKTVHEPLSALQVPSFEPLAQDDEAASAPKTVHEPLSALQVPSLEPLAQDDAAASAPPTVHEPASALQVPSFEGAAEAGSVAEASSECETVVEPPSALELPPAVAAQPGSMAPEAARAVLEVTVANGSSFRVELGTGRHDIGRARDCAVWIDDRTLTRRHAVLTVAGDTVTIEDQDSRNGTFMDGARLTAPVTLRVGDIVTFGDQVSARLVDP